MRSLSQSALQLCESGLVHAERMNVVVSSPKDSARVIDCGVAAPGGLAAGLWLAELCMSGLGSASLVPGDSAVWPGPAISVYTDAPVTACLASQYAGWRITGDGGKYFAMGSGPMRAVAGEEVLFDDIGCRETASATLGVLEASELPSAETCRAVAEKCGIGPAELTLAVARTASLAGSVQVVARSVETALHKLHELKFDVRRVRAAHGTAPLPPIAANDLDAIGRTNDAILYGAHVTLWVDGDDDALEHVGAQAPSSASRDYGQTFGRLFAQYDYDFYRIDPLLFSPARITINNVTTGRVWHFGELRPDILRQSFGG